MFVQNDAGRNVNKRIKSSKLMYFFMKYIKDEKRKRITES